MNFCSLVIAIWLMLFTPPFVSAQHDHSKGRETTSKTGTGKNHSETRGRGQYQNHWGKEKSSFQRR